MRKIVIVAALLAVLCFHAATATAQVPTAGNVYFGYSYYNTNMAPSRGGLNGWQGTLEGKVLPVLGIVADITGQYGSLNLGQICPVIPVGIVPQPGSGCSNFSVSTHLYEAMFGPRVGVPIGKFRPFAEVEVGVGHVSAQSLTATTYATAVGGGIDCKIFHALAWRVQGDYVHTHFFSTGQNNVRISTGLVLRF